MESLKSKVTVTALSSRLFIWALSVVGNLVIPDHDAGKNRPGDKTASSGTS